MINPIRFTWKAMAATTTDRAETAQHLHHVRRVVPVRFVPTLVRWRLDQLWADPDFRREQEDQMRFLLEHTSRASEVSELGYAYAEQMLLRAHLRWHWRTISRQEVRGVEWLTTRRDPNRAIVLSFMHHNRYDGLFGSLARAGAPCHALMARELMLPEAGTVYRQHRRVVTRGAHVVPADIGTEAIADVLRPGVTLAIASDFPGRTPVTFLGRRVLGSFGAARIATLTNSPVVLVTARRDGAGSFVQVEAPLEPADYAGPAELLDDILRRHEEPVLAWPEALDGPKARWGVLED
jgi:hypothetical protein